MRPANPPLTVSNDTVRHRAAAVAVAAALGFGFSELGGVTRHAQPGNERPRLFRAIAEGVFGVPTVTVAGEHFWGDDRLEEAARALAA